MNEVGGSAETKPIFRPLNADDPDPESTKIESLCISCGKNGITQILLTKIPFYKEVVLMSFECEECGYRNNEIQPGGQIEEKGVRITLRVTSSADLNRQVCKSDYTSVKIPEVDFEIPSQSQKGEITTVEGIIGRSIEGLEALQPERRKQDPKNAEKIDQFLGRLRSLKSGEEPFTLVLEDISGNSFVSNPNAPMKDAAVTTVNFVRSKEQNHVLGIYETEEISSEPIAPEDFAYENIIQEVMQFQTNCSNCRSVCQTNMKLTNIPYFKEVVIMATNCEVCGHRSNEVKSGGGIEPKGLRIELKIIDRDDFSRDILKSETCSLQIPEIELEIGPAVLGGRFTTVEGLLVTAKEQLYESQTMFHDSQDPETKRRLVEFMDKFDLLLKLEKRFTLILDDPAGNSYVQSFSEPEPDDRLTFTKYERTFEQNEELGLNDIKTENYEEN
ncbi:UNVERIFIED_CONTAM: hypothetical protein PYX00_000598 [Menopon gallinae]|uniref:Zinc finger protein ZPR1 n=1 Tax=Menopon gallinae TaxID=328185 RepID=A0AAW2I976_9NEOP